MVNCFCRGTSDTGTFRRSATELRRPLPRAPAGFEPATSRVSSEVTRIYATGKSLSPCRYAPNRSAHCLLHDFFLRLMQAARRASRPRRFPSQITSSNVGTRFPHREQSTKARRPAVLNLKLRHSRCRRHNAAPADRVSNSDLHHR